MKSVDLVFVLSCPKQRFRMLKLSDGFLKHLIEILANSSLYIRGKVSNMTAWFYSLKNKLNHSTWKF